MTLLQLHYLAEIAESGSISKASKNLFISQSSISNALRELESELGFVIFLRHNKGVEFTEEGRRFYECASPLLEQEKKIMKIYGEKNASPSPRLRISSHHYPFVSQALVLYMQSIDPSQSKYDLRLRETTTQNIIEDVATENSDVGVLFLSNVIREYIERLLSARDLEFHLLKTVVPHAFISKEHPLARRQYLDVQELGNYPFVAFDQERAASLHFSEEIVLADFQPSQKAILINDRASTYNIVANTDAISVGTGLLPRGFYQPGVMAIPIKNPGDYIHLGWIQQKNTVLSPEAKTFIDTLKTCLEESDYSRADRQNTAAPSCG
ncbi:MAG: LysR family transcriptional regulator [Synergistaceae bacterium]|jgi:DNA-binding transcriptional LysR family regulator|nr:LysR family transcriptional regulator [Synergistaceae bacterium]